MSRPMSLRGLMNSIMPNVCDAEGTFQDSDTSITINTHIARIRIIDHELLWSLNEHDYVPSDSLVDVLKSDKSISSEALRYAMERKVLQQAREERAENALEIIRDCKKNLKFLLTHIFSNKEKMAQNALQLPVNYDLRPYLFAYKNRYRNIVSTKQALANVFLYLELFFGKCEMDYMHMEAMSAVSLVNTVRENSRKLCSLNAEMGHSYHRVGSLYQKMYDILIDNDQKKEGL